jgi:hypothetical protein
MFHVSYFTKADEDEEKTFHSKKRNWKWSRMPKIFSRVVKFAFLSSSSSFLTNFLLRWLQTLFWSFSQPPTFHEWSLKIEKRAREGELKVFFLTCIYEKLNQKSRERKKRFAISRWKKKQLTSIFHIVKFNLKVNFFLSFSLLFSYTFFSPPKTRNQAKQFFQHPNKTKQKHFKNFNWIWIGL